MQHNDPEQIINEIRTDRRNGAAALALRGLDFLEATAAQLSSKPEEAEQQANEAVRILGEIRPSIGAIGVQAVVALSRARGLVSEGMSWKMALLRAVQSERQISGQANASIAELAKQEIGVGGVIVTCSWSMTVLAALQVLKPTRVIIGDGHPLGDGASAANWIAARGMEVHLLPDAAVAASVNGARAVIIGADQILADGSVVNRTSSFCLALSAGYFGVPFYVLCQRTKLSGIGPFDLPMDETHATPSDIPSGVTYRGPLFEITPPELITAVLTESGSMNPRQAGEVGQGLERIKEQILG